MSYGEEARKQQNEGEKKEWMTSCYPQIFSLQSKIYSAPFPFLGIVTSPHSHDHDDNKMKLHEICCFLLHS